MQRDRRTVVRTLALVGAVFVVLSLAQLIWNWVTDRSAGPEVGLLLGGVLVMVVAALLARTERSRQHDV